MRRLSLLPNLIKMCHNYEKVQIEIHLGPSIKYGFAKLILIKLKFPRQLLITKFCTEFQEERHKCQPLALRCRRTVVASTLDVPFDKANNAQVFKIYEFHFFGLFIKYIN